MIEITPSVLMKHFVTKVDDVTNNMEFPAPCISRRMRAAVMNQPRCSIAGNANHKMAGVDMMKGDTFAVSKISVSGKYIPKIGLRNTGTQSLSELMIPVKVAETPCFSASLGKNDIFTDHDI